MSPLTLRVEAALRFQLALPDKQIVDLFIDGRSIQELGQRFFGIDVTGAEYAKRCEEVECIEANHHCMSTAH